MTCHVPQPHILVYWWGPLLVSFHSIVSRQLARNVAACMERSCASAYFRSKTAFYEKNNNTNCRYTCVEYVYVCCIFAFAARARFLCESSFLLATFFLIFYFQTQRTRNIHRWMAKWGVISTQLSATVKIVAIYGEAHSAAHRMYLKLSSQCMVALYSFASCVCVCFRGSFIKAIRMPQVQHSTVVICAG